MSAAAYLLAAVLVGLGSGLGALARWGLRELLTRAAAARAAGGGDRVRPWATFGANLLACFLTGIVVAQLGSATGAGEFVYLLLAVGFCGGMSTLSTAAFDIVELVRRTTFSMALAYLMLSAGCGMAALWLGLAVG